MNASRWWEWTGTTLPPTARGQKNACPPEPNGRKQREGPTNVCIHGGMRNLVGNGQILTTVVIKGMKRSLRWGRLSRERVPMASTIWPATCGNGWRTGTTRALTARARSAIRPDVRVVKSASFAEEPGTLLRPTFDPRISLGCHSRFGSTISGFAAPRMQNDFRHLHTMNRRCPAENCAGRVDCFGHLFHFDPFS